MTIKMFNNSKYFGLNGAKKEKKGKDMQYSANLLGAVACNWLVGLATSPSIAATIWVPKSTLYGFRSGPLSSWDISIALPTASSCR